MRGRRKSFGNREAPGSRNEGINKTISENVNSCSHCEKQQEDFSKKIKIELSYGWIMCKNCWPPTPEAEATRGPGVNTVDEDDAEDTDVITVGDEAGRLEDDEEVEVEEGEEADAVMETGEDETAVGDVLALLMDKSTGSVCVWK